MVDTYYTLADINNGLTKTLAEAVGLEYTQTYNELTEGIQDTPVLRVYPTAGNTDVTTGTDRTTFSGKITQTQLSYHADLYATQRKHLGEDMGKLIPLMDSIIDVLEAQKKKPFFGVNAIKSFNWKWNGIVFAYGRPDQKYAGARFVINLRMF